MSLNFVTCSKQVSLLEISVGGAKRGGGGGTGVECAVRRVFLEHVRGYLCENATLEVRTPGKHSPPKKRLIARAETSCSYVPGGL